MKPASFLALVVCAPILLASSVALAAPGKTAKGPKKKPKTATSVPAKEAEVAPEPAPVSPEPTPVAPETKVADSKPAEVQPPVPVAAADHPAKAQRDEEEDGGKAISVAPLLGFGTNHLNFGFGARAGYTLPAKVYLGVTFMYHLGVSESYGLFGQTNEVSTKVFYPAGEVGYDLRVGPVTIRPYAGVGVVFLASSVTIGNQSASHSESSLALYPAVTAQFNIPHSDFFVGGDARLLILTRGGDPSLGLFATGGMKF
jgi:outer membrane protein with beta-barrel domain